MKMGHIVKFCRVRRFSFSKGILKWVSKGPNNIIGPKFIRGPNLVSSILLVGILGNKESILNLKNDY